MRFLIDRCAGGLLADWLRKQGHDVVESRELGPDPGDRAVLDWAAKETRILVTIDIDLGELIYVENPSRAALVRLLDVPAREFVGACFVVMLFLSTIACSANKPATTFQ